MTPARSHYPTLLGVALAGAMLFALPLSAAPPGTPAPARAEPDGFGSAKFGMSLAEVWDMYEQARLLPERKSLGASVLDGPYVERLELTGQAVPGLAKPTTVELRFWKDKLWGVIVYFGENDPEAVTAYLARRYGPTTARDPNLPIWPGEKVTATGTLNQGWFGYSDNAMSQEAAAWVRATMNGSWKGETPEEKAERLRRMAALTPGAGAAAATPGPDPSTHSGR